MKPALVLLVLLVLVSLSACTGAQTATLSPTTPAAGPSAKPGMGAPSGSAPPKTVNPASQAALADVSPAVTVRGGGNLAVSTDARLMFGTGGKVEKLNVQKGDNVKKGMVLAKLDTASLEVALAQAKVNLDQAKLAQTQAYSSLESAKFTLEKTKTIADIKDEITKAQWDLQMAEAKVIEASRTGAQGSDAIFTYLREVIKAAKDKIEAKNKEMGDLLGKAEYSGIFDPRAQKYDRLIVQDIRMKQLLIDSAQLTVDKSQSTIDQAQKNLDLAQKQLNDATIVAPFDGVVATLDVKEGDIVAAPSQSQKPTIYLIDLTAMELNIYVNELDVPKVKVGQKAVIGVDAFPNAKLEGKVAAISPVPSVQGKIVDYEVKIAFSVPQATEIRVGMNAIAEIATK